MDNPADTLDQADEEILTTASDEALEAATGIERGEGVYPTWTCSNALWPERRK